MPRGTTSSKSLLRRAALYFCTDKSVSICTFVPVDFAEALPDQRIPFLEVELVTVKSLRVLVASVFELLYQ
jgi:hypothetical protein